MITYISTSEARSRFPWSEEELTYLCENGHLPAHQIGAEWYLDPMALKAMDRSAVAGLLRQVVRQQSASTAVHRRRATSHQETRKLLATVGMVGLIMIVGLASVAVAGRIVEVGERFQALMAEGLPETLDQIPLSAQSANLSLVTGPTQPLAATWSIGGWWQERLLVLGEWLLDLPELLAFGRDRVVANWRNFLGGDTLATNAGSPPFSASSTTEIQKYINAQIDASLKTAVGQLSGSSKVPAVDRGVVVVPATGDAAKDQAVRQQLSESFSDQVAVRFDSSGTSGVITPLFRKISGGDYFFLITPIR